MVMKVNLNKITPSNSKWRIQYGGTQLKELLDSNRTCYSTAFGVADYESELEFL